MTKQPSYSQMFACMYDQATPVGDLGRGSHYSVFRSVQWRDIGGDFRDSGRLHDLAVIWDEDHDTRVIGFIEQLHMHGLLWPVVFVGERKGMLTVLLWHDVDPVRERSDWYDVVKELAEKAVECDVWSVDFGCFYRDPANSQGRTNAETIINDSDDLVVSYLQSIDVLWQLGEKSRSVFKRIMPALDREDEARQ